MKFLIFAFVVASILDDCGTFQEIPVDQCSNADLVALFKKYALRLVDAAIKPLRTSMELLEAGCECLADINVYKFASPMDTILATMSIAKDYDEDLKRMSESNLSKSTRKIEKGLLANIRLILFVLQTPRALVDSPSESSSYKKYLFKDNRGVSGTSDDDRSLKSRLKCLQMLDGFAQNGNEEFFDKLDDGFEVLRQIMASNDDVGPLDALWDRVHELIAAIPEYQLETPPVTSKAELEELLKWLDANGDD